jgi:4-hydroxybenzoate polyprenyltransferase
VFPIPQLVLSLAWGFAVLISWSAVTQNISPATWLLWAATVMWTLGFDTVYAMSDREDDRRIGIKSSALFFGKYAGLAVGIFWVNTVIFLAGLGHLVHLSLAFWITLIIASVFWLWQYCRLRQSQLPSSAYELMFRQNVWIGFLLLSGMILGCRP